MPLGIDAQRGFTIHGTFSMDMSNKRGISNGSERAYARGLALAVMIGGLLKNVIVVDCMAGVQST